MCSVCGCGHAHDRAHVDEEENLQEFSPSIIWVPRVIGFCSKYLYPLALEIFISLALEIILKNKTLGICEKVLKICSNMFKISL